LSTDRTKQDVKKTAYSATIPVELPFLLNREHRPKDIDIRTQISAFAIKVGDR